MKRCFIAIKIPIDISVTRFIELLKKEFEHSRINWVNPGNMHLTLAFLGEIPEPVINSTIDTLGKLSIPYPQIDFEIMGFGYFGSRQNPTVLWLGTKFSSVLNEIKNTLDEALLVTGFIPDRRPFQPHLTVGRIKSFDGAQTLEEIYRKYKDSSFLTFSADSITLYESRLSEKGPEYFVIRNFPFQN